MVVVQREAVLFLELQVLQREQELPESLQLALQEFQQQVFPQLEAELLVFLLGTKRVVVAAGWGKVLCWQLANHHHLSWVLQQVQVLWSQELLVSPSQELALQLVVFQQLVELARQVYLQEQVSLLPEQHQWLLAQLAVW